jgi:hypothetical protein
MQERSYVSSILDLGIRRGKCLASLSGPQGMAPGTRMGDWASPRASLDIVEHKNIS